MTDNEKKKRKPVITLKKLLLGLTALPVVLVLAYIAICGLALYVNDRAYNSAATVKIPPAPYGIAVPGDDEIFGWIRDIVSHGPRVSGSPASIRATEFVRDSFVASGLQRVAFEPTDTLVWRATRVEVIVNGKKVPCGPIRHCFHRSVPAKFSTGPQGLMADMVYVGHGSRRDYAGNNVRGKVVVARVGFSSQPTFLMRPFAPGVQDSGKTFGIDYLFKDPYSAADFPGNYLRAMEGGAVAFIGILEDNFESNQYNNESYASYDPGQAWKIPGVWLSPASGDALEKRIRTAAAPIKLTMHFEGELTRARARAVVGYLPGQSDEIILIEAHHDSDTTGAVEDASGVAEVLALARYFGQVPIEHRKRTLMFATMDTHFTDYAVHHAFANRHIRSGNPLKERVVAVVTMEHVGNEFVKGPDGQPAPTGLIVPRVLLVSDEVKGLKDLTLGVMRTHRLDRTFMIPTWRMQFIAGGPGLPADSSDFIRAGAPVVALVGAPMYLYDAADTLDKVAKGELHRVARAFVDVVFGLSALPGENFVVLPFTGDF
jgi:hypothetical protein